MARISNNERNSRVLNIICAYMRLRDADHRNLQHSSVRVRTLLRSYGFSEFYASNNWKAWDSALKDMFDWVTRVRVQTGLTPSRERLIGYVSRHLS